MLRRPRAAGLVPTRAESENVTGLWEEVVTLMNTANKMIGDAKLAVEQFRQKLAAEDIQQLSTEQKKLELSKKRHATTVIDLIAV